MSERTTQYWKISGYESTAEVAPVVDSRVAVGVDLSSGDRLVVVWDEVLHRWQEVTID